MSIFDLPPRLSASLSAKKAMTSGQCSIFLTSSPSCLMKKTEVFLTTTFRAQTTVIWKENFWHFFWRSIWQIFCLAVEVRQGTLAADGRGWGPAGNNGPRMIAVGVRQETLAVDDRGSGPVANTSGWSGREHWAQMGAVEEATRRRKRRTRRTRRRWGWHKIQQPSPVTWQLGILFWGVPKNVFLNEKLFGSREDMPDRMSGDSQRMSDKMSEEMPERMLEDFLQSVCEIESNCNQHSLINPQNSGPYRVQEKKSGSGKMFFLKNRNPKSFFKKNFGGPKQFFLNQALESFKKAFLGASTIDITVLENTPIPSR